MNLIGKRDTADATRINFTGGAEVPKMLLAWSLESSTEFSWEELAKTAPDTVAAALIVTRVPCGVYLSKSPYANSSKTKTPHL
jgi:hypothetical protein